MISLLDRYVGRQVLYGTLFTVVLLSLVLVLGNLLREIRPLLVDQRAPLVLVERSALAARVRAGVDEGKRVAVLFRGSTQPLAAAVSRIAPDDATAYAHDLYANLRALDANGTDLIVVEHPPSDAAWEAVRDRLSRAAAGTDEEDET